jgi:DNA-binding response OmpR family regulator
VTLELGAPLRVLFLEDDAVDAELIVHVMHQADSRVRVDLVSARKRFTELLAAREYDIVLADYRLPGWTGMEVLREMRRLGFEYLSKPVNATELFAVIETLTGTAGTTKTTQPDVAPLARTRGRTRA